MKEESGQFISDEHLGNIVCPQLNGAEYEIIYKENMLNELDILSSALKMPSEENSKQKKQYITPKIVEVMDNLLNHYFDYKSLFQKSDLNFQCSLFQELKTSDNNIKHFNSSISESIKLEEYQPTVVPLLTILQNPESYTQNRKKRNNENFRMQDAEIKLAAPKSIQDILKNVKTSRENLNQVPGFNNSTKKFTKNKNINSGNISRIEFNLRLKDKSKDSLKFGTNDSDRLKMNNSENSRTEWDKRKENINKKISENKIGRVDSDIQNNNITIEALNLFVNNSITEFKDQLKRIENTIRIVERKLESARVCQKKMDLSNVDFFTSSTQKEQKAEETNDGSRFVKRVLNHKNLVKDILARHNLKVVSEAETDSTVPFGKSSFDHFFDHLRNSLREANSSTYVEKDKELSKNEKPLPRSRSSSTNKGLIRSQKFLGSQGSLKNKILSQGQGLWKDERSSKIEKLSNLLKRQGLRKSERLSNNLERWKDLKFQKRNGRKESVKNLKNSRYHWIDYDPNESLFYQADSKSIPRFIEPFKPIRKRDYENQETFLNFLKNFHSYREINKNQEISIAGTNKFVIFCKLVYIDFYCLFYLSDPVKTNFLLNTTLEDHFGRKLSNYSNPTSWKMFLAKN